MSADQIQTDEKKSILHVCKREVLRPIRDEILRLSGFEVESTCDHEEALAMYQADEFSLVLVDVEGAEGVPMAEHLCGAVKNIQPDQVVAFVCNWRVAFLTDCPDEILRTEFDPAAFVAGVKKILETD
jgi:DNA-binding response OmpR family regulator